MVKPGRPSPGLDDYLYWQERLVSREASGLSIDEFCAVEDISRSTFYRWAGRLKDGIPDAVKEEGESLTPGRAQRAPPFRLVTQYLDAPPRFAYSTACLPPTVERNLLRFHAHIAAGRALKST